jgi:hypothetical protein
VNSRLRHADNLWKLDKAGTLSGRAYSEAHRGPLQRLARGVLIAIGIALCSASPAGQAQTMQQELTPFRYASFLTSQVEASCLFKIALKESNVRYNAINRFSGASGAWQFMNTRVRELSPLEQVEWAVRYAETRYGSPCKAWDFWKENYWW